MSYRNCFAIFGNCLQNNCPVTIYSMFNEIFSCALTLQCFASDSSVWGGSPHEVLT